MQKPSGKTSVNIYDYSDWHTYLRDWFEASKRANPKLSFRIFARQAGFSSGSTVKMALTGQRRLTLETARKFAHGMGLAARQTSYLQALVVYERATTADEKARAAAKVGSLRPRYHIATIGKEYEDYLSNANLIVLREMLHLKNFQEDPSWIGRHLKSKLSADDVKAAFRLLKRLGLIKRNEKGRLMPADPVLSTAVEVDDIDLYSFHHTLMKRADEALAFVPSSLRHNMALTFPVPLRKLNAIKNKIHAFQNSLIELIDDDQNDFDEVFHVSVALFPATCAKSSPK